MLLVGFIQLWFYKEIDNTQFIAEVSKVCDLI